MTVIDNRAVDLPEGWIRHDGGPCPVPPGSQVSVIYRDGERDTMFAIDLGWAHLPDYHPEHDIIAYKPEPTP